MSRNLGYKGVALDAFGTLVTPVGRQGPYQEIAKLADDWRQFRIEAMTLNIPFSDLARRYGMSDDEISRCEAELAKEIEECSLFPDAQLLMEKLKLDGLPYVICSNLAHGYGERVRRLVPEAAAYVFSYEIGDIKPNDGIYRCVVDALTVAPSEILFIGDTPKADADGPRRFGMSGVHLDRRGGMDLRAASIGFLK